MILSAKPLIFFLIGVIFIKWISPAIVKTVGSGTSVSLLCSNILTEPSYIAWFKQTKNGSLPFCVVTQFTYKSQADPIYFNGFKMNHIEMAVNDTISSLKIVNAEVSDSGIFFCGSFLRNHMVFHNSTQLVVNGIDQSIDVIPNNPEKDTDVTEVSSGSCNVYYTLTLILSCLVLLPTVLAIVVLIRMKERNKQTEDVGTQSPYHHEEEQNLDLNYAALSFAKKKSRRPVRSMREVETNVVYAATR
ncbi:novel immune-type receptor 7b [Myxocyprinus asiaticus]|uniref:novel immune-type receptor 7b n=1 Tax=Myxocyprinus asiaticus TaxID=70543 RepID=UPI0022217A47|nr:novel immune-type receptor 7b [Myxocyprinus asiaticus]